jgi:outer membrane protein assembly factor BamA
VSWPFSVFSRVAATVDLAWRTRTYRKYNGISYNWFDDTYEYDYVDNDSIPQVRRNTLGLGLSWTFDNAEWGVAGPVLGSRLWAGLYTVPKGVLQSGVGFWKAETDLRHYFLLFKRYTLAIRAMGGVSQPFRNAVNPHAYLLGGDSWTLNWRFNEENYSYTLDETSFGEWDTPLRGFRYHEFRGSRMALFNVEWRFPLIQQLLLGWPIPLGIRNVEGVLFADFGGAWEGMDWFGNRGLGYGWGARMNLGIFVLRYSMAWSSHAASTVKLGRRSYWSLGADF